MDFHDAGRKEKTVPAKSELDVFLKPQSLTVIGATERPGSWGSFIMEGLLSRPYPGKIYPVNYQANEVFGIRAYREVGSLPESPDLAILTIPEKAVEQVVEECGRKGVKGISIITAGFGEAVEEGKEREQELVRLARSYRDAPFGPKRERHI